MNKSRRTVSKLMMLISGLPFVAGFGAIGLESKKKALENTGWNLLSGNSQLHDLGQRYFECGFDVGKLIDRLYLKLKENDIPLANNLYSKRAFRELIGRDFEDGEVLHVNGWVLSKTEVGLGLIAYLAAGYASELRGRG